MHYSKVKKSDIANGPGIRVSLFASGCTHACPGCFNQETWDFNHGNLYTPEIQNEILRILNQPHISGLSLLGGEPMHPKNQEELAMLAQKAKEMHPEKDIWCYTGYLYEEVLDTDLIKYIDVLVDGKFEADKKDVTLKFRGSKNQRLIDVVKSLMHKHTVLWD